MAEETKATKRGVGTVIREKLLAGATNKAALDAVKDEFPGSETTMATVSWYRSDMRKRGEKVPTAREASAVADAKDPLD